MEGRISKVSHIVSSTGFQSLRLEVTIETNGYEIPIQVASEPTQDDLTEFARQIRSTFNLSTSNIGCCVDGCPDCC